MKKSFMVQLVLIDLLFGCAGLPTPDNVNNILMQIQTATKQFCKFEPALASIGAVVLALFPGGVPIAGGVEVVVNAICSAPATVSLRRGARVGEQRRVVSTVNGSVTVYGVRVK